MVININNEKIELDNKEVQAAKTMVAKFISEVRKESFENNEPTFFFTALIIMHLMSQDAINKLDIVDYFHCISYDEKDILYARKFLKKGSCMVINGYISFKKETKLGKYAYSTRLNIISMEGVARLKENAVREIPVQEQDTTVFPEEKTAIKENMPKQTLEESFDVMDCTQPGTELPL